MPIENLDKFRETYLHAIDEEQQAGQLGRIRAALLRRVADNPRRLERLAGQVAEEYRSAHGDEALAAPDWPALLDFIKQLLPLIAQLVSLFRV